MAGEASRFGIEAGASHEKAGRLLRYLCGDLFGRNTGERLLCLAAATLGMLALAAGLVLLAQQKAAVSPDTLIWFVLAIIFVTDTWRIAAQERAQIAKLAKSQKTDQTETARSAIALNFKFLICFYIVTSIAFFLLAFAKHIK